MLWILALVLTKWTPTAEVLNLRAQMSRRQLGLWNTPRGILWGAMVARAAKASLQQKTLYISVRRYLGGKMDGSNSTVFHGR